MVMDRKISFVRLSGGGGTGLGINGASLEISERQRIMDNSHDGSLGDWEVGGGATR